jgi:VanZ family protein
LWWPVALWILVILFITSVPGSMVPQAPPVPGIDKLIHFTMYAVLGALAARARRTEGAVPVVVGILLFAVADEWHQRWIPGRGASVWDWMADAAGASVGYAVQRARQRQEHTS